MNTSVHFDVDPGWCIVQTVGGAIGHSLCPGKAADTVTALWCNAMEKHATCRWKTQQANRQKKADLASNRSLQEKKMKKKSLKSYEKCSWIESRHFPPDLRGLSQSAADTLCC